MTHIDLSTLPIEHPLRNWPLADIDAECADSPEHAARFGQRQRWKSVKHWKLGPYSYNDLGPVWHINLVWRVKSN